MKNVCRHLAAAMAIIMVLGVLPGIQPAASAALIPLTVTAPVFGEVDPGYIQPAEKAIEVTRGAGMESLFISNITITPAAAFDLIPGGGTPIIAGSINDSWKIQPKAGLSSGTFTATITVNANASGNPADPATATGTDTVTFTVTGEGGEAPKITTITLPNIRKITDSLGIVFGPYHTVLSATGTEPITWRMVEDNLPDHFTLSPNGELISDGGEGAPIVPKVTVRAENMHGFDEKTFIFSTEEEMNCIIASSIYGSSSPEVWTLQRLRDGTLGDSDFGKAFINVYYTISPTIVSDYGSEQWLEDLAKPVLDKAVVWLQNAGVPGTPYDESNPGALPSIDVIAFATHMYPDINNAFAQLKALNDAGTIDLNALLALYSGSDPQVLAILDFIRKSVDSGGVSLSGLLGIIRTLPDTTPKSPKTGENLNIIFPVIAISLAVFCIIAVELYRNRTKKSYKK